MITGNILLQAAPGAGLTGFLPMILIIVVFYFFMIRPQMKKSKEHKKYIEALKVNDKVVTTAGIHGRIMEVNDTSILLDVGNGVKIRFDKNAVSLDSSKAANAQ
ncbi:preprotein translocase subunit YajC [Albibacterium indicum]|uniref:preprotein translocase subunit YajC n=1 Tax=Albibacterium indicum TaxID=2292082 RepID=UPI000E4F457C|nr:preprotein translocase subunit YajC [Pedobacter indicus]